MSTIPRLILGLSVALVVAGLGAGASSANGPCGQNYDGNHACPVNSPTLIPGSLTTDNGQVGIRVPGLAHVDRAALQRRLGYDVRVSRTTVWMPRPDEHEADYDWRTALLDLLERLAAERIRPASD